MATAKITDVQGYEIALEKERWQHIIDGHPEMEALQELLLLTLKESELIQQDPVETKFSITIGSQAGRCCAGMTCT